MSKKVYITVEYDEAEDSYTPIEFPPAKILEGFHVYNDLTHEWERDEQNEKLIEKAIEGLES